MRKIPLVALLFLAACASSYEPMIDPAGVDMGKYQENLNYCRQLSQKKNTVEDTIMGVGEGAIAGAVLGVVIGALTGNAGGGALAGTAIGGTVLGLGGASDSISEQKLIIRNCLAHRGYTVLD